jgi:hypothetical protein
MNTIIKKHAINCPTLQNLFASNVGNRCHDSLCRSSHTHIIATQRIYSSEEEFPLLCLKGFKLKLFVPFAIGDKALSLSKKPQ